MRRALAAAVLLALAAACGGGGGGGGGTGPTPPAQSLTFTPAGTSSGASVTLQRSGTDPQVLVLEVRAQQVSDLYGLYFDLAYPAAALSFEGATEGSLLSSGGIQTSLQVAEQSDRLVVGLTRLGAVSGADGAGTLLTLRFRAIATGNGSLSFSRQGAVDSNGRTLQLDWLGGTARIQL